MIVTSLASQTWQLKGFWPWVPLLGKSMETSADLLGVTDWIPASVPGGVHYDLYRAGLIEHPYRDLNSLHCEWVERRWWIYRTTLIRPNAAGRNIELYFHGLDYEVEVYVDDRRLATHRGMFLPLALDLTALFAERERLELRLLFRGAPDEMGQIGRTSETFTQKSRFGYKWDFSTRLVNIGVWDDVQLRVHDDWSFDEIAVHTDLDGTDGIVGLAVHSLRRAIPAETATAPRLIVTLHDPDGREVAREHLSAATDSATPFAARLRVPSPRLWFPNGYGSQPLYRLQLQLVAADRVVDERTLEIGLRRIRYERNPGGPDDALPYTFVVNGRHLHIQGVNLTPLDHLYGNVTPAHYAWIVRCMRAAGVNLVRVWGGGVIEREEFYALCDRHGILIWQEFIQSSSGVDNVPSQRPEFLALLRETALTALRTRRHHPSLAVWSGGNELMSTPNVPSTFADSNLALLRELVRAHDPQRLFLPTSASGPVEYMTTQRGVMHDVHGHWKYQGPADHYALYGEADSLFHSEFGVDGCSDARSLRKFLSPAHQRPATVSESLVWRHHGEWWDTVPRDRELFGAIDDLALASDCSQWIQAEGLRFILEANRRHQPRNSGSIVWQLNEPWPNTSCTSLVDYFGEQKLAYHWMRLAFAGLHASLDYRQLVHPPGTAFHGTLHLHGRGAPTAVTVRVEVLTSDGRMRLHRDHTSVTSCDGTIDLGALDFTVDEAHGDLFFVRLSVLGGGVGAHRNVYVFSTRPTQCYAPALALQPGPLAVEPLGEWQASAEMEGGRFRLYRVANTGTCVALFVRPEEITNAWWLEVDRAGESLFPGESLTVQVRCHPKRAGGFLVDDQPPAAGAPEIRFRAWGQPSA